MLIQKKKHIEIRSKMSYEEYCEFKAAIHKVAMEMLGGGPLTTQGRDSMWCIMNFVLPAMEDEIELAVTKGL